MKGQKTLNVSWGDNQDSLSNRGNSGTGASCGAVSTAAHQLSYEDAVELDLCHQASPRASGENEVLHSTVTLPHHNPAIPGGRVAAGRPVGARSWYLLLVTGLTVATISLGPCEAERGLQSGLAAPPAQHDRHEGAQGTWGWPHPYRSCRHSGC